MGLKQVRKHNGDEFVNDIRFVESVYVWANQSETYLKVQKVEVLETAATKKIHYYLTDKIFVRTRTVMVII